MKFIHENALLLITFLLYSSLLSTSVSCNESKAENPFRTYDKMTITLESGEEVTTYLAYSASQQSLGLSKVKNDEFGEADAMLFPAKAYDVRQFWMPETHFNLDLFFLGPDMKVLDVHRNLQHHLKREPRSEVPLSKMSYCQHVLELRADSKLSKKIKVGMTLKTSLNPEKIVSDTRLKQ